MRGWGGEVFENFCGRTLERISVGDRESTLKFDLRNGEDEEIRYVTTDGDCCSQSWWADIVGAAGSYGGIITGVKEVQMPEPNDNRSRQEYDRAYGYQITTDRGVVDLVFRNSSNGYYGGSAYDTEWPPKTAWLPIISNDWRA